MPNAEFVCVVYPDRAGSDLGGDGWSDPSVTVPNGDMSIGADGWTVANPDLSNGPWRDAEPPPADYKWKWYPGRLAWENNGGPSLVRAASSPLVRSPAAIQWRMSVTFTVKGLTWFDYSLVFGSTPISIEQGNSFPNPDTFVFEAPLDPIYGRPGQEFSTLGTYTIDYEWPETEIDPKYVFFGPEIASTGKIDILNVSVSYRTEPGQDFSCLVDQIDIQHGRDDSTGQPDAPSATFSLDLLRAEWPSLLDIGSVVSIDATAGDFTESRRFVGRIADINIAWGDAGEDTPDAGTGQVIATGFMADLGRRVVGDIPWPRELDGTRAVRVLSAAGAGIDPVETDPGTVRVLPLDIDAQPALNVLHELAESASGVVWEARDGAILYADAEHRRGAPVALALDACQVLVTPTWRRTTDGLINQVSIGYGPTPEGSEQPRFREISGDSVGRYGTYGISLGTQLAYRADAVAMGTLLLARNDSPVWLFVSLPLDIPGLTDAEYAAVLGLEMHDLLTVTGLPAIATAPTSTALWVEGWKEHIEWGVHEIELNVSGYCRTSPPPRWIDVDPSWTWPDFPGTWSDAACIGMPVASFGRWADIPATTRWIQLDPALTYDTWPD